LEAHWFSTMFGWYNFAAMWVSALCVITLIIIYLKKNGYMSWVNENHLHDMGKLIFGFSIFWAYVWFSQFMLIYYANIPEETVYFYKRWEPEYKFWFWLNVVINFVAPKLVLGLPPLIKINGDRKSTRLNSSHVKNSYAVFCLKKKIYE